MNEFSALRHKASLTIEEVAEITGYSERTVHRWEHGEADPKKAILDQIRTRIPIGGNAAKFSFIDLFAGIGGLRLGFESIGGKCVFTSEWDKYSRQTYCANFRDGEDHIFAGDITQVDENEIPHHDVLLAGFPCQPFSIAGVSKKNALGRPHGFDCETQGTLFFDVERIIEKHRPRAFLLENVKNLERHDKGRTFAVIRDRLERKLGYHVSWRVVSSHPWVPQKRERIFIAGFRDQNSFRFDDFDRLIPPDTAHPKLGSILQGHNEVDSKYTLSAHLWTYLQNYKEKHAGKGNGFGFSLFDRTGVTRTLSARYHKDGSEILVNQGKGKIPRRLTPVECARLMGFETESRKWIIPVSDTQAYRQFGNAVVVPAVEAIARYMEPWIIGDGISENLDSPKLPLFSNIDDHVGSMHG
jgi:DNA (cytosine-5)-methyltransferase 1